MATAALPPVDLIFLIIPAYSGLFYLWWQSESNRQAFFTGWWFGLAYFASGLYWFAYALLVEPDKFAWMIPFAVLGLPSVLAIYYGLACVLARLLRNRLPLSGLLQMMMFAVIWTGVEVLRGYLFTGFPWNLAAYSWSFSEAMVQPVALVGSYLYSGWTVLLALLPATWLLTTDKKKRAIALGLSAVMVALPYAYGAWRLQEHPTAYTDRMLQVVQGNIPQAHKWDPNKQYETVQIYKQLSSKPGLPEDAIIVWPETAYPYFLEEKTPPVNFIAEALPKRGILLTGAMRAEWNEDHKGIKRFFNSLHAVRPDGSVEAAYDKVKLVPFGEFVPLRGILPVEKITYGIQDFTRGAGAEVMQLKEAPSLQPLICYEAIFPQFTPAGGQKAEWLLNVTNDAWFGVSSGPYQHLQMARFRAVEQGLPLVRAANTGISAVFDAYGRELAHLPLNERGAITMQLPKPAE